MLLVRKKGGRVFSLKGTHTILSSILLLLFLLQWRKQPHSIWKISSKKEGTKLVLETLALISLVIL